MLRSTEEEAEDTTAYKISSLSGAINISARSIRKWVILDCCHSAAAFSDLQPQAGKLTDVIAAEAEKAFPPQGTALLCASSADQIALNPTDGDFTMFSGVLLDVLKSGSDDLEDRLSLKDVYNLVEQEIFRRFRDKSVRPELYSPDQRKGDVALIPFFPNLVRKTDDPGQAITGDFLVFLSQTEAAAEDAGPERDAQRQPYLGLRYVAQEAYRLHLEASQLGEPRFVFAADVIVSERRLEDCVRALCRAKVVIFDATGFEPAIMFLAGIRAVVRRGVELLSVGGGYALGNDLDVPFNIKDANIVAHSREQDRSTASDSVTLLTDRIRRGMEEMGSSRYLDLPVYDAIRELPAERRGIIPNEEGVLVLCPFHKNYKSFWEDDLRKALQQEMKALRTARNMSEEIPPTAVGVSRSFELNSPRLVTKAVYEAIRRMQSCVIDLTRWSPNVLFEFGVRLAASGNRTVCIADRKWHKITPASWQGQCQALASLFLSDEFLYDPTRPWQEQKVFRRAYGKDAMPVPSPLLDGGLHTLIESVLDLDYEPASRPVYVELLDHAALFSRDPGAGGRSKPAGLFPGNAELVQREETAEFERLLAAWLFVSHRYEPDEILRNTSIREPVDRIIQTLIGRHADRLDARTKGTLSKMRKEFKAWRDADGRVQD